MENKAYIGHGTKHNQWDIIDVVLEMDKVQELTFEYEGKRYLKFSVAQRKVKSQFGVTHTAYVRTKAEQKETVAAEPQPKRRTRKKAA